MAVTTTPLRAVALEDDDVECGLAVPDDLLGLVSDDGDGDHIVGLKIAESEFTVDVCGLTGGSTFDKNGGAYDWAVGVLDCTAYGTAPVLGTRRGRERYKQSDSSHNSRHSSEYRRLDSV